MPNKLVAIGSITMDRIVKNGEVVAYNPGGVANLLRAWVELTSPQLITPVSVIGDDEYAKRLEITLKELDIDDSFVLRVSDAESRLYEIDVSNPQRPKIQRKQDAEKLMATPRKDVRQLLPYAAFLFYQSFATVFETPYVEFNIATIEASKRSNVPVVLDNNIRQASVGKLKTLRSEAEKVYDKLDLLKVNEGEAKAMLDPNMNEAIEGITLEEREIHKVAQNIASKYAMKAVAVTMGERGSYILTRNEELRFPAIKPERYVNSLGAGDAWCAGYCMKYVRGLNDKQAGFLATVLGTLATEGQTAYPSHFTSERIRNIATSKAKDFGVELE